MELMDVFLSVLLIYGFVRGVRNGFFVELASFVSILLGIYIAIKCSSLSKIFLENHVSWNPKNIQIIAFVLTFFVVITAVSALASFFTSIANYISLGIFNTVLGGLFGILKTILILSVVLNLYQKINAYIHFTDKKTFDKSLLYNPTQKVSKIIYPSIEEWFTTFKTKELENNKK